MIKPAAACSFTCTTFPHKSLRLYGMGIKNEGNFTCIGKCREW